MSTDIILLSTHREPQTSLLDPVLHGEQYGDRVWTVIVNGAPVMATTPNEDRARAIARDTVRRFKMSPWRTILCRMWDGDTAREQDCDPEFTAPWPPVLPPAPSPPPPNSGFAAGAAASEAAARVRWTKTQQDTVRAAILRCAQRWSEFTADAVWADLNGAVPVTKGLTALLLAAERAGWLENSGATALAKRGGPHDHGQRLTVWRSRLYRPS